VSGENRKNTHNDHGITNIKLFILVAEEKVSGPLNKSIIAIPLIKTGKEKIINSLVLMDFMGMFEFLRASTLHMTCTTVQ
jgi:hypothetical protein